MFSAKSWFWEKLHEHLLIVIANGYCKRHVYALNILKLYGITSLLQLTSLCTQSRSTQRAIFEIVSHFTAFGLKWILMFLKSEYYLYLLNGFILNLPARNPENIVPATLHKFASRIKHWFTRLLTLRIV